MNLFSFLNSIQKLISEQKLRVWKAIEPVPFTAVTRESSSVCLIPQNFNSISPEESSGGRLGTFNFKARIYVQPKNDIAGESAIKEFYSNFAGKILDALCGVGAQGDNVFQSPIFLTGISQPQWIFNEKGDFFRYIDLSFQVRIGL